VIIEAAVELMDVKKKMVQELEAAGAHPDPSPPSRKVAPPLIITQGPNCSQIHRKAACPGSWKLNTIEFL